MCSIEGEEKNQILQHRSFVALGCCSVVGAQILIDKINRNWSPSSRSGGAFTNRSSSSSEDPLFFSPLKSAKKIGSFFSYTDVDSSHRSSNFYQRKRQFRISFRSIYETRDLCVSLH